jgi:hypothetical protein
MNDAGPSSIPRPIIDPPLCHAGSETTDEFLDKPFTHAPLDLSALLLAGLVALPVTRRAPRPRKRRPDA